ncbi:MAG TPA: hypothetical protein DIT35_00350 [Rhodospirillaceae bacterium]|nr:hypothetical protein [Rhodospirillaceae bacterium]
MTFEFPKGYFCYPLATFFEGSIEFSLDKSGGGQIRNQPMTAVKTNETPKPQMNARLMEKHP